MREALRADVNAGSNHGIQLGNASRSQVYITQQNGPTTNIIQTMGPPKPAEEDCLKSLAFPQIDMRYQDVGTGADGTCTWLLQHPTYRKWTDCHHGLLWIKGKPGSGKSTLLRYAL